MKKLCLLFTIIVLFLSGCSKPAKTTTINGQVMTGELTSIETVVEANHEEGFVKPGDTLTFTIVETLKDEKGKTVEDQVLVGYTIEVDSKSVAELNGDSVSIVDGSLSGQELAVNIAYNDETYTKKYTIRKDLQETINSDGVIISPNDYDVLVNKERSLPSDYAPSDLVKLQVPTQLNNPEINQLRKVAADALVQLFAEAKKEGFHLVARSGYRSYGTQKALYNNNVASKGQVHADKYSARPGKSEHQTGLSIDITCQAVNFQLTSGFGETKEGLWVKENAHKFGFIIRYPKGKEEIVGYAYEPWHLRYLGVELSTKIHDSGLTMEEYFSQP